MVTLSSRSYFLPSAVTRSIGIGRDQLDSLGHTRPLVAVHRLASHIVRVESTWLTPYVAFFTGQVTSQALLIRHVRLLLSGTTAIATSSTDQVS